MRDKYEIFFLTNSVEMNIAKVSIANVNQHVFIMPKISFNECTLIKKIYKK